MSDQLRMLPHGLRKGAENDPLFRQLLAEGGLHRHGVDHRIHGYPGQRLLLVERDPELLERRPKLRIDLLHAALQPFLLFRRGVVDNILIIDHRNLQVRPVGHGHGLPLPKGAQAKLQQPGRFLLQGRDAADGLFVQPAADGLGGDVTREAVFVVALRGVFYDLSLFHILEIDGVCISLILLRWAIFLPPLPPSQKACRSCARSLDLTKIRFLFASPYVRASSCGAVCGSKSEQGFSAPRSSKKKERMKFHPLPRHCLIRREKVNRLVISAAVI